MRHTHRDILTPEIRKVYANELMIIRRIRRSGRYNPTDEYLNGVFIGLDTAFRRCDWLLRN